MSGRNWESEDGMGFAGLVPTLAEKREEEDRHRVFIREINLRKALAAAEQRNRELQARLDAAEELSGIFESVMKEVTPTTWLSIRETFAASPTPSQPAAGEERTT